MYCQIPTPAPIEAPFTPAKLLAFATEQDELHKKLSIEFPPGTVHDGRNNSRWMRDCALGCAQWMEKNGHTELLAVGPFIGMRLPKRDEKVRIKKGARVFSTDSRVPNEGQTIQRARVVVVRSCDAGYFNEHAFRMGECSDEELLRQPELVWAGTGGFWYRTDLNNIELIGQAVEAAAETA